MKMTYEQYANLLDYVVGKLLNPDQPGGAWFNGSKEAFEEWAGDVFDDVVAYTLGALGIVIEDEEQDAGAIVIGCDA